MRLGTLERQLCDIQGRLFELSLAHSVASEAFISSFMESELAAGLDRSYDRLQWMGEEYLFDEVMDKLDKDETTPNSELAQAGALYPREALYWMGWIYRFWHFYTGESSAQIYAQAPAQLMLRLWPAFHTLDNEMAIDRLQELATTSE